jgi:lipoprotein-anchoring transpeptidase ErfK/SrfK
MVRHGRHQWQVHRAGATTVVAERHIHRRTASWARLPSGYATSRLARRIHGTNAPGTIGGFVSHGCIRMYNQDIMDLYSRVSVGTRVVVTR